MFVSFFPRPEAVLYRRRFFGPRWRWRFGIGYASESRSRAGSARWALRRSGRRRLAVVRSLFCADRCGLRRLHGCGSHRIPGRHGPFLGSALILFTSYFQVQVCSRDQHLVWTVLRPGPGRAFEVGAGHGRAVLRRIVDLCRHRARGRRSRRDDAILRQPLHFPLADGDERFLCRQLATAAYNRRRLPAGPGRRHALCQHHGRSRGQSH